MIRKLMSLFVGEALASLWGPHYLQHDQNIANADGATVRSDINNALGALFTNSSGLTAPSTTVAYQWWADTTTGLLKIRNAANTNWVTVGTLASTNLGLAPTASPTFTGTAAFAAATFSGNVTLGDAYTDSHTTFGDLSIIDQNTVGFAGLNIKNDNSNLGIAGMQLSSDNIYYKAAIGLLRQDANGNGRLNFYVDPNNDAAHWGTVDLAASLESGGALTLTGSSQPQLKFTPTSGTSKTAQLYQTGDSFFIAEFGVANRLTVALGTGDIAASSVSGTWVATQAQMQTGSATSVIVTPGRQHYHQSAAKAWVNFNGTGVVAIGDSYNVSSITDNGAGDWTVNITTAIGNANFSAHVSGHASNVDNIGLTAQTTTTARINSSASGVLTDSSIVNFIAFGD